MQADELQAIRKALGWTQQQMAEGLGMSRKLVVEMEGDKAPIERRTELAARYLAEHPEMLEEDGMTKNLYILCKDCNEISPVTGADPSSQKNFRLKHLRHKLRVTSNVPQEHS